MKPLISTITLGVDDLEKALSFYRDGLGLKTNGIIGTEFKGDDKHPSGNVVMFELDGGLTLALYPRSELSKDASVKLGVRSSTEMSVGHFVESKRKVDELLARAKAAGATITEEPHERPWGNYSGYFQDPDGHLWEIIWSPQILL